MESTATSTTTAPLVLDTTSQVVNRSENVLVNRKVQQVTEYEKSTDLTTNSASNSNENDDDKRRAVASRCAAYQRSVEYIENHEDFDWISPFSPHRIDPQVAGADNVVQFPTKSELRAVIPPHCFQRSLPRSLSYVIRDILQGLLVWYVVHQVLAMSTDPPANASVLSWQYLLWRLAWNVYAMAMTFAVGGLWVLGHECGHGAFSEYPVVNGLVGWILHSALLVPFWSWAYSHAKHHRRTNDMIDGETHVPCTYQDFGLIKKSTNSDNDDNTTSPYERVSPQQVRETMLGKGGISGSIHQVLNNFFYANAWLHEQMGDECFSFCLIYFRVIFLFQFYLLGSKADGKVIRNGVWEDHFRPTSKLFPQKLYWKVLASDLGCAITLSLLGYCAYQYGFNFVWFWYVGPYTIIHMFLVGVTWLQHTDPTVPHFDEANWTWMTGALAGTIDRPVYPWINYASHNICTTHVVHHCFHTIPHYHAVEATAAIRAFLEPKGLYNYDPTPWEDAFVKVGARCHFVDSTTDGVQYYHSLDDVPKRGGESGGKSTTKAKQL